MLNVVAENAARLCDATDAMILRVDGDDTSARGQIWTTIQTHRERDLSFVDCLGRPSMHRSRDDPRP